jgi:hypothetical protein
MKCARRVMHYCWHDVSREWLTLQFSGLAPAVPVIIGSALIENRMNEADNPCNAIGVFESKTRDSRRTNTGYFSLLHEISYI